jgi:hypothetical protein
VSGGDHGAEAGVLESGDTCPRIDRFDEEDFAFEDIADAGHHALIGEGFGDLHISA